MSYCSAQLNSVNCTACSAKASYECPNIPGYQDMLLADDELQAAFDAWQAAKSDYASARAEYRSCYWMLK